MKKFSIALLAAAALLAFGAIASADSVTYSGGALNGLTYVGNPVGDAQYVAGTPDVAALYTADAGLADSADSPAVFASIPDWDLSTFNASYSLLSSSGGGGNPAYWILWVNDDGGTGPSDLNEIAIIGMGGPTIGASSAIHVYDPNNLSTPSYWGDTLSSILNDIYSPTGVTFGDMPVEWAGIEIGDWAIDDSISASADIDSITVASTPEPSSLVLLGTGLLGLAFLAFRKAKPAKRVVQA